MTPQGSFCSTVVQSRRAGAGRPASSLLGSTNTTTTTSTAGVALSSPRGVGGSLPQWTVLSVTGGAGCGGTCASPP